MVSEPTATGHPWVASWIWLPEHGWTVDLHLLARKAFTIDDVRSATLHISAHTDYKLVLNGAYLGRGPIPADPRQQSFDTYDVGEALVPGTNVIAVVCHNYGIGTHWQNRGHGGLIVQLDVETAGDRLVVASDGTWRVRRAESWAPNSPRMFWSAGFAETVDLGADDPHWTGRDFDDGGWSPAEVLPPRAVLGRRLLAPREVPALEESWVPAASIERGTFTLDGVHAVRFDGLVPPGQNRVVHARTDVFGEEARALDLHVECDDAFKLWLNDTAVIEQGYDEEFARTRVWRGKDEYEQVHDGVGLVGYRARVTLREGRNRLAVAVDHGPRGWGFCLAWLDPATGGIVRPRFAADGEHDGRWLLTGPWESTGLSDGLDGAVAAPDDADAPVVLAYDPFDYGGVTDYATLMRYERRSSARTGRPAETLTLRAGEFLVVDLGAVHVGHPELELTATGRAILDIGYGQVLSADRSIGFSNDGRMKYVDRVRVEAGTRVWQPLQRRTGRYLHLSCRQGDGVTLDRIGLRGLRYPIEQIGHFACSDPLLTRVWEVSRETTHLLMQYGYQDCLKREEGTLNTSSFNYASRAAACEFGNYALARRGLRLAARTQDDSGWFSSHGVSSFNSDEPTQCLWWVDWLNDFYRYSGDAGLVSELFEAVEDALRYFAKAANRHGLLDGGNWPVFRQGQYVYVDDTTNAGAYLGYFAGELFGMNLLYYAALAAASSLSRAVSRPDRAAFYAKKAARVQGALNRRLWDASLDRYGDWRAGDRLAGSGHPVFQIAALYFDLCDAERREHLLRYLCDEVGLPDEERPNYPLGTFGFYFYFLEVLFRYGRDGMALDVMRRYHGRWAQAGATTFGEHFQPSDLKGKRALGREYEVHAYGTSAHLHFYANLLGVQPAEPGFARVRIAPRPGGLAWAKGRINTPAGPVAVSWEVRGAAFALAVEGPGQVGYEVRPPPAFAEHRIVVNGEVVAGSAADGVLVPPSTRAG